MVPAIEAYRSKDGKLEYTVPPWEYPKQIPLAFRSGGSRPGGK